MTNNANNPLQLPLKKGERTMRYLPLIFKEGLGVVIALTGIQMMDYFPLDTGG
jgi:hypothetical protein